jgi:RimJ/RimL family protein N-acetyltransferase
MSDGDFAPIRTDRLTLRRFTARDVAAFQAYRDDPDVARWQSWTGCSLGQATAFVAEQAAAAYDEQGSWFQVAIAGRADDRLIGDIGLHVLDEDARLVEIGLSLAAAAQGRGLATEALDAVIRHLFRDRGKHRLHASIDTRNPRSYGLFERLGFRREAHFRRHAWVKGEWCDEYVYALLTEDWMGRDAA